MTDIRYNNFDIIRLFAALQVVVFHTNEHLNVGLSADNVFIFIIRSLPGVPIFFFISGFVVSLAYERSALLSQYSRNRLLRIYPALWMCLIVSVFTAIYFGQISPGFLDFAPWFLGQISFVQFYNPDFLRDYGVGVLNGSLWTITVELQFYLILPFLYKLVFERFGATSILWLIILFLIISVVGDYFRYAGYSDVLWFKLYKVTLIPYLYVFLIGVFFQKNFSYIKKFIVNKFLIWFIIYYLFVAVADNYGLRVSGNTINPVLIFLLCMMIASAAYTRPNISDAVLQRNDISYGVYLYHMVVINLIVEKSVSIKYPLISVLLVTCVIASLSWWFLEKPVIKLKKKSIHVH